MAQLSPPTISEMLDWLSYQDLPDELTLQRAVEENCKENIEEEREGIRMLAAIRATLESLPDDYLPPALRIEQRTPRPHPVE